MRGGTNSLNRYRRGKMSRLKKAKNIFIVLLCCIMFLPLENAITVNAATKKVVKVTSSISYDDCKEKMTVRGLDKKGKTVWSYTTKSYEATELRSTLCVSKKSRVYVFESGKIIALKKQNGEKIWTVKDVTSAGFKYCFDNKQNIYVIGFYDKYLYKISSKGEVLWKCDVSKTGNYWPYKISIKKNIVTIRFDGGKDDSLETHYVKVDKSGKIKKFK